VTRHTGISQAIPHQEGASLYCELLTPKHEISDRAEIMNRRRFSRYSTPAFEAGEQPCAGGVAVAQAPVEARSKKVTALQGCPVCVRLGMTSARRTSRHTHTRRYIPQSDTRVIP